MEVFFNHMIKMHKSLNINDIEKIMTYQSKNSVREEEDKNYNPAGLLGYMISLNDNTAYTRGGDLVLVDGTTGNYNINFNIQLKSITNGKGGNPINFLVIYNQFIKP